MNPTELLTILHTAEHLKDVTRHAYTSGGRHESVAEHSWRLSLMALLFCETAVFLFRVNTTGTDAALWHTVLLPMIMVSLLAFPLFYLGAWAISRIAR